MTSLSPSPSLSLSQADQSCCFLKFRVSLAYSESDAGSPQGRSDTHELNPPQKATGKTTQQVTVHKNCNEEKKYDREQA